jgi:hypothetical protein
VSRAKKIAALLPLAAVPFVVAGAMLAGSYSKHRRRIRDGWRWE